MAEKKSVSSNEYAQVLADIKREIQVAQIKSLLAVNQELLKLYWYIGKTIVSRQASGEEWGTNLIEKLALDLKNTFPGVAGFSRSNIFRMRAFYRSYEKVAQPVRQLELPIFSIPWGHNIALLQKLKDSEQQLWYAQKAIDFGWSRTMLEIHIERNLYSREGQAITNFTHRLPAPHSDMAQQSFKDPYIFDFLTLHKEHNERDIEQGLIDHIQKFLLELGHGFAFVGRQYHIEINDNDFYIDLLFYHLKLRCFVVVELKNTKFIPEYAGKLNFYLSAVDDLLRTPGDQPTIGLLLCKTKDNFLAEYALRDINKPMGVASYETKLVDSLPKDLKGSLPSVEEIEAELAKTSTLADDDDK